ncbi:HK97-gp10 family putative phage morphogenesis protein [Pseudooceanicola algae]|uniref:Phage protein, HK97 gp10 family n=1 Tax=Pseudooceanicola algae TaxID=1537215 RepID=A0A418SDJ5_9RHOB|nr:HK97-gp10 family putative phage morphogenesis protein [Pseudooceanicola algae]QPM89380.1 hypothetical protein PSAL_005960 [Pseudooceanicola algae]
MTLSMKLEGFKEIEITLKQLPRATAKNTGRRILRKAATPIAEAGGSNAPRDSGGLVASYGVGTKLTKSQKKAARGLSKSQVEVFAGPGEGGYQAGLQTEFGNEHQAPEPHLRPAWDAHKNDALEIISSGYWEEVQKVVARYARKLARKG